MTVIRGRRRDERTVCQECIDDFGPQEMPGVPAEKRSEFRAAWTEEELAQHRSSERIAALFAERESLGMQRYGKPLNIEDGRDMVRESVEELLDAAVYLTAKCRQLAEEKRINVDAGHKFLVARQIRRRVVRIIAEIVEEL